VNKFHQNSDAVEEIEALLEILEIIKMRLILI